ncbi:MAG TPA: GGDEF domain-containing protein [Mycobacteriales bacterium]|nr:GGDEF domain-containing protein [Mycobacteriales bacterium]
MGLAPGSASRRTSAAGRAGRDWLGRFGDEPPTFAVQLLGHFETGHEGRLDVAAICAAAASLGVLRAQRGHAVAGLVEDLVALRASLDPDHEASAALDRALTAATQAYVDEVTAILQASATRDPLTELPNRAAFDEALQHEIAASPRNGPPALLLIDLDGFKGVNDSDGHLAGDAVLVGVAALLRAHVRASDLPCRLGGDEFAVVLPSTTQARAAQVARRVLAASRSAPGLASPSARVHLSIGVGWLAAPGSPEELVAVADAALYDAKGAGGNNLRLADVSGGGSG